MKTDATVRSSIQFSEFGNAYNFGLWGPYSNGTLYFEGWGSELSISGRSFGDDRFLCSGGPAGKRVFHNGQLAGSSGATGSITTSGKYISIGSDIVASDLVDVFVIAAWNRQLSDAESLSWHSNPWQLFAPRRIFVPVSAGGGSVSLVAADSLHAHAADAVVLSSATALAIAEALHAHATDNLTLGTTGSTTLTAADALHAHAADAPTLTTSAYLAAADALHDHSAENLTLGVSGVATLTVAEALHTHSADNMALTSAHSLSVADAVHAHSADGLTISTATLLAIAEALHDHAADNVALSSAPFLQIADGLHAHTADGVTITVDAWLVVADASHGHSADNLVLLLPGGATYPDPATVLAGIAYGPTGADYVGTFAAPTAADIATAVLSSLNATAVPVNVKKVNDVPIRGTGTPGDTWGPV